MDVRNTFLFKCKHKGPPGRRKTVSERDWIKLLTQTAPKTQVKVKICAWQQPNRLSVHRRHVDKSQPVYHVLGRVGVVVFTSEMRSLSGAVTRICTVLRTSELDAKKIQNSRIYCNHSKHVDKIVLTAK